jgi:hypothetical protein
LSSDKKSGALSGERLLIFGAMVSNGFVPIPSRQAKEASTELHESGWDHNGVKARYLTSAQRAELRRQLLDLDTKLMQLRTAEHESRR